VVSAVASKAQFGAVQNIAQIVLIAYAIILALHLWISTYANETAKHSVQMVVSGSLAGLFWIMIVLIGIVVPLFIVFLAGNSVGALTCGAVLVLAGVLTLRYVILKAGKYSPLLPS
jgi:formate-dependent nitrite reductase membrane component NrfD